MQFEINSFNYKVEKKGLTVLQACLEVGIAVPRFCFHEKLSIAGNCRMCLVEVSANPRSKKPIASCALPLSNQMVIFTNTILVKKARESVLEFLLINHPMDCPICDQAGECDLQDQSFFFGNDKTRFYENKRVVSDKFCGPFIKTIMTRCIHCTRCVRFATEIAGVDVFGVTGRGSSMEIGNYVEKVFNSELSGNIIDLCPVGALTSKNYAFIARPWELRSVESLDIFDTFGSRIRIDSRGLNILRILPSYNKFINEEWISDKIRFCFDGLNKQRLNSPMIKNVENFLFVEISWVYSFSILFKNFFGLYFQYFTKNFNTKIPVSIFFGKTVDVSGLLIFKKFLNFLNINGSFIGSQSFFFRKKFDFLGFFFFNNYLSFDAKQYDSFFLFLLNPRLEIPLLNLKIRKNFLVNNNFFIASFGYTTNLTYMTYDCGINFKDLLGFIKGRSFVCRKLINFKTPLFLFSEHFLTFFSNKFNSIFNSLLTISNYIVFFRPQLFYHNFKIILTKNNYLNQILLNFNTNSTNFFNNNIFNILLDTDNCINFCNTKLNLKEYSVYVGSHGGNTDAELSDLLLPSYTFTETSNFFFNLEGKMQIAQYAIIGPKNVRELWRILYDFYVYIIKSFFLLKKKKKEFLYFKAFFNYDQSFIFVFSFCFEIILKNTYFLFSKKNNIEKIFINLINIFFNSLGFTNVNYFINYSILNFEICNYLNNLFLGNLISFYKGDIITKASKSMNLAYNEFEYNELNYF